jgi:hypothetical protein
MASRFFHSGPAILWVVDVAPAVLAASAATPANWVASCNLLGTCERYPQVSTQVIREEVRNDIGGDAVISKPAHGQKMTLQAELNNWDQAVLDAIISAKSGGNGVRSGVHNVITLSTFTDIIGNSCGLFVYYPDQVNRNEVGILIPQATLVQHDPTKIGNRTASMTMRFDSNTCFLLSATGWTSFDYLKYPTGTAGIDTALMAKLTGA